MSGNGDRIVYVFPKNQHEEVRASLGVFEGREVVSLRVWFDTDTNDANGNPVYRPSRKGLTLSRNKLPELRAAIDALLEAEREVERAA
jgi:hypothetical protein